MEYRNPNSFRTGIWGVCGGYLIYLAIQIFWDFHKEGGIIWYAFLGAIAFIVIGIILIYKAVILYKEGKKIVEKQKEEDMQKEAAEKAKTEEKSFRAVILAAGEGTRMESGQPKVLQEINDVPMAVYVKEAANAAGAGKVCYVIGYEKEKVRIELGDVGVSFALQEKQNGTVDALRCAGDFIGTRGEVLVLCADMPLLSGETLRGLYDHHLESKNAATILSANLAEPSGHDRIIRDEGGDFLKIAEEENVSEEEKKIQEINTGAYVFNAAALNRFFERAGEKIDSGFGFGDLLHDMKENGEKAEAYCIAHPNEVLDVDTPEDFEKASRVLTARASENRIPEKQES